MSLARSFFSAALAVGLFAAPLAASATVVVPRTIEEMSRRAATVVRAKVVARQSAWDADHRRIHTYTELSVLETVTGDASQKTVVVRTMGGEVGDIGMRVSGVAHFEVGTEVLVFLRNDPLDAAQFQVIGMSQGKYEIDRSSGTPVAVARTHGLAFARRGTDGKMKVDDEHADKAHLPLSDLIARVKAALQPAVPAPTGPKTPTVPTVTTPSNTTR